MRWICWVEIQGLYAAAAREAGLAEAERPIVVLRGGRVFDGCREAFAAGLQLGSPARQVLRDVPGAAVVEWADVDATARARAFWDRCLAHTPYVEPVEPHQALLGLPLPDDPGGPPGGRGHGAEGSRAHGGEGRRAHGAESGRGQAADIKIHADWILKTKQKLNELYVELTGQPMEKIERDTDRDFFMSAEEAKEYGLIDEVIMRTDQK